MALSLEPTAEFTIGGSVDVSNVGATVTGGVQVAGSMTVKNGSSFSGSTSVDASPLTPEVKANGSVGLKLGGELLLGPGVGTEDAGVIAGRQGASSTPSTRVSTRTSRSATPISTCAPRPRRRCRPG